MEPDTYNQLFTMHGIIMVFFFLIPSIPAVLGNFLVPLMIGAKDLAFPRLNLLSWYIYIIGGAVHARGRSSAAASTPAGPSTRRSARTYSNTYVDADGARHLHHRLLVDPHRPELHRHHPPDARAGHDLVPAAAVRLVALRDQPDHDAGHAGDRDHHRCWSASSGCSTSASSIPALGGDPVLFQHLFWFYSHPAVYIMILPAHGRGQRAHRRASRARSIFGYTLRRLRQHRRSPCSASWSGATTCSSPAQSIYAGAGLLAALSLLVAIPSAIKVFNWTATLYKGSISFETPMLYALGFIGLFTIGGLTGLFLATLGIDVHVHDTYFVVAHFHYIMVGGTVMAYLGGLHYWWPKMTGRMYPEFWSQALGADHLRRLQPDLLPAVHPRLPGHAAALPRPTRRSSRCSTCCRPRAPSILGVGYLLPLIYFVWSLQVRREEPAPIRGAPARSRVGDHLAAADRELLHHPGRHHGRLRVHP